MGTAGAADLPEDGAERPSAASEVTRNGGRTDTGTPTTAVADVDAGSVPAAEVGGDGGRRDGGGCDGLGSGGGSGDGVGNADGVRGVTISLKRSCCSVPVEHSSIS